MQIRIVKIKPWAIKFSVDGQKYLIHEDDDIYEPSFSLFKFDADEYGWYTLEYIRGKYGHISGYDTRTKHGETYRDIDLVKFLNQLCYDGFGEDVGLSKEYVQDAVTRYKLSKVEEQLAKLDAERERLMKELAELRGA